MTTITISNQTYQRLVEQAQQKERSVDTLAEELLKVYLQPTDHPYIICKPGCQCYYHATTLDAIDDSL